MAMPTSQPFEPGSLPTIPKSRRSAETTKTSLTPPLLPYTGKDFSAESLTSATDFLATHDFPDWHQHALCSDKPQEWFFGGEEQEGKKRHRPTLNMAEVRRAQMICAQCPVMQECLTWALVRHEEFGIWGGTTGRDRAKWWRENNVLLKRCSCGELAERCLC